MEHSINYDPGNLYKDIQDTICELHVSGKIHNEILSDVGELVHIHAHMHMEIPKPSSSTHTIYLLFDRNLIWNMHCLISRWK